MHDAIAVLEMQMILVKNIIVYTMCVFKGRWSKSEFQHKTHKIIYFSKIMHEITAIKKKFNLSYINQILYGIAFFISEIKVQFKKCYSHCITPAPY